MDRPTYVYDLLNQNPTNRGVFTHRGKLDQVTAGGARVFRELFNHCFVLGARGRKNIEVRQYLRAVDAHVEGSGTGCREVGFGKVQPHRVARSRRKAWNRVREVPAARRLVAHPTRPAAHST